MACTTTSPAALTQLMIGIRKIATERPPVALVYMPWGSLSRGAIGASILKRCLKQHGYPADVHYLNIRFAEQIGVLRTLTALSHGSLPVDCA